MQMGEIQQILYIYIGLADIAYAASLDATTRVIVQYGQGRG